MGIYFFNFNFKFIRLFVIIISSTLLDLINLVSFLHSIVWNELNARPIFLTATVDFMLPKSCLWMSIVLLLWAE